jgi:hypothetical protein
VYLSASKRVPKREGGGGLRRWDPFPAIDAASKKFIFPRKKAILQSD